MPMNLYYLYGLYKLFCIKKKRHHTKFRRNRAIRSKAMEEKEFYQNRATRYKAIEEKLFENYNFKNNAKTEQLLLGHV